MASTNFTTHYSIPLPLGTDLTTPMDYNEAAEAVDTALFGAVTDAGNASIAAGNAVNTANAAAEEVDTLGSDLSQEKAKIIALQTRVTNAENEIDDVRADASDMITAYNEPTATSTHAYAIGDFFIYNNTLYKATAAIAIGATIVPDTNCETTNVSTELIAIKSAFSNYVEVTGNGVKTYEQILNELHSLIDASKITSRSHIQFINAAGDGGNHSLELFTSTGSYTFRQLVTTPTYIQVRTYVCSATGSSYKYIDSSTNTEGDSSSTVFENGRKIRFYYN